MEELAPEKTSASVAATAQAPKHSTRQFPKFNASNRAIILVLVGIAILGSAYGYRGLFVAATIDGQPISRLAVIRQLEQQGGEVTLNAIIVDRLIVREAARAGVSVDTAEVDQDLEAIEARVTAQGMAFDAALKEQGLTLEDVRRQIKARKLLEKILGDSVSVTDADIDAYLVETKLALPQTMSEADFRSTIATQLKNQKFEAAADRWIADVRGKATITYFVDYGKPVQEDILPPEDTEAAPAL